MAKKKRIPPKLQKKILTLVNAALSTVTVIMGVLMLLAVEIEAGIVFSFLALDGAALVAIMQETNAIIVNHTKRTVISSICCIVVYTVLLFLPIMPLQVDSLESVMILAVIASCLYIGVRFGKVIAMKVIDHKKGWLLETILLGLILLVSIIFLGINWNSQTNVCYYLAIFLITEGFIFVFMTFVSGFSARRFVQILIRTHAAEILTGLIFFMLLSSVVLEIVEGNGPAAAEGGAITDFGDAMWYCFATITTIGFGDFTAKTFAGRIITVLLGIYGIVVVALITSIIVNLYNDSVEANKRQAEELAKKVEELEAKEEKLIETAETISEKPSEEPVQEENPAEDGED